MKEEEKITGFSLTREWFEWAFDNHTKINPSHSAVYFFHVYLWNSLGGKKEFDSPNGQAMEGCGIRCIKSYTKTFNELVEFGFIRLVQAGSNKYKAKVVSLIKSKNKNEGTLAKSINISKKTPSKESQTASKQVKENKESAKDANKNFDTSQFDYQNLFLSFSDSKEAERFWNLWQEYKVEIKKMYKTTKSAVLALEDVLTKSKGDAIMLGEAVRYSISREWKGIYHENKWQKIINKQENAGQQTTTEGLDFAEKFFSSRMR